jgi:hypothetical protein
MRKRKGLHFIRNDKFEALHFANESYYTRSEKYYGKN